MLTVLSGVALIQLFEVTCTGWHNCLDVQNDRLLYSHYVSARNETAALPLYSERNTTVRLFFPVGAAFDDYHNLLTVDVSNYADYAEPFTIYPVTVSHTYTHRRRLSIQFTQQYGAITSLNNDMVLQQTQYRR